MALKKYNELAIDLENNEIIDDIFEETGKLKSKMGTVLNDITKNKSSLKKTNFIEKNNQKNETSAVLINSKIVSKIDNKSTVWGLMLTMQENLNMKIGIQKWKRYIRASFWNHISTPINFIITLFTALSAGQTGTNTNILSNNQLFYILFISFILSTINTFFKLKEKAKTSHDMANNFDIFGSKYEIIYFQPILNNVDVKERLHKYQQLQREINDFIIIEEKEKVDYITDFLFAIIKYSCFCFLRNKMKQIPYDERYWILDGMANTKKRRYIVDMDKLFDHDFSITQDDHNNMRIFYNDNDITSL